VPNLHLTDISVRALKASEKHVTYWDTTTPGFGVRVGKRTKTWTVMRGRQRERVSIGQYGAVSLSEARKEAMRLLSETTATSIPRPVSKLVREARAEFLEDNYRGSTSRWPHLVKLMLDRHCKAIDHKQLADLSDDDIRRILDKLHATPSAQLHVYRTLRTFLKWCTRPPRRYLKRSPMEGYPPPSQDRKGTRVLTDDELKAVWNASESGSRAVLRLLILWGTRNGETCVIQREWQRGDVLTIPGARTKNGRDHGIPILPLAAATLNACPRDGDFYFPSRHSNERSINPSSLNRILDEVQQETSTSGWQLRDIRRTFRSNMARLKVPRDVCEVLINHAPSVLDEIYDRYDRLEEKREALAKYEGFLIQLLGPEPSRS
jgi:integrase